MLNPQTKLTVLHDDNGTFIDYSKEAFDYSRDPLALGALHHTQDYLYIGFEKPINALYVEMGTANTNANTLTLQYYTNTGTWASVQGYHDDTKGFTRSGFIQWNRNLVNSDNQLNEAINDADLATVNSTDLNWYRFRPDAYMSAGTSLAGINLVFSDDRELQSEFPALLDSAGVAVDKFLASGQTSHILTHVAVRNEIVQRIRNKDYIKYSTAETYSTRKSLNQWDLLEIDEVRQAAKYFALSKIFLNVSDASDDSYAQKSALYEKWAIENINLARASLDTDNDGVSDTNEKLKPFNTRRITR